jgi:hypothetical protein
LRPQANAMKYTVAIILLFLRYSSHAQPTEITIDGVFTDWVAGLPGPTDGTESLSGVNLLNFKVTNDENWLYLKLTANIEFDLTDNLIPHNTTLYIDADNNPATGFGAATNFGSELGINFKTRTVFYDVVPAVTLGLNDILVRALPTVTSTTYEIAIRRNIIPDGIHPIFPSNTIKLLFRNSSNGDYLPDNGTTFSYSFNNSALPAIPFIPLEKTDPSHLRITAYNSLGQLGTAGAQDNFDRILSAIDPDIIAFSEAQSISAATVKTLLDSWIPIGGAGWYTLKDDFDMITCSRWPFLGSWTAPDRQFPTLIDLPEEYLTDILVFNAHLQCCTADATRQNQCDAAIQFIQDAKTPGGTLTLPTNTPIVYCGDLNLVGYAQQLNTLLTGNIQNNVTYGPDSPPDWDGSSMTNLISRNNTLRMAYTWRDDADTYPPGHLDYFIYTDAVMQVGKSFVLETEEMEPADLATYGLNSNDCTGASDHFPITADYILEMAVLADFDLDGIPDDLDNCPTHANPLQEDWNTNGIGDTCEDSDNDGLSDENELNEGTDPALQDTDGDGLTDGFEIEFSNTDPTDMDSDNNLCSDGEQLANLCGVCPSDLNNDGSINITDLLIFITSFGTTCP